MFCYALVCTCDERDLGNLSNIDTVVVNVVSSSLYAMLNMKPKPRKPDAHVLIGRNPH